MKIQTLKGFRDILPSNMLVRKEIVAKTEKIVIKYGFLPLETPALEQADLLLGKYGTEEKLIYKLRIWCAESFNRYGVYCRTAYYFYVEKIKLNQTN